MPTVVISRPVVRISVLITMLAVALPAVQFSAQPSALAMQSRSYSDSMVIVNSYGGRLDAADIPQFDPHLGELLRIDIDVSYGGTLNLKVENTRTLQFAGNDAWTGRIISQVSPAYPGGNGTRWTQNTGPFLSFYDGTLDYAGRSGYTDAPTTVTWSESLTPDLPTARHFQEFIGTDDHVPGMGCLTYQKDSLVGPAWLDWGAREAIAECNFRVTYVYEPAPAGDTCRGVPITIRATAGTTTWGTAGNDVILGTAGADTINGGGGDDTICGLGGPDAINGGPGDDTIDGGLGWDTLDGSIDDDSIYGNEGNDVIYGGHGNDRIFGEDGNDLLLGFSGRDRIDGGDGRDRINGQNDNDTINAGPGNDQAWGAYGNDRIRGDGGSDLLFGGWGSDELSGGNGWDTLYGEADSDELWGGDGQNKLYGGWSDDALYDGDDDSVIDGGIGTDDCHGGYGPQDQYIGCEAIVNLED